MIVSSVGGYDSVGFWILVIGLLLAGSILISFRNIFSKVIGVGLFIYGGVLLLELIQFTIDTTPNLPGYVGAFPTLFAVVLLLVVLKMMNLSYPSKGKK